MWICKHFVQSSIWIGHFFEDQVYDKGRFHKNLLANPYQNYPQVTPPPPTRCINRTNEIQKILVMFLDSIYCERPRLDCFHVKYTWIYAADVKSRQHLKTKQFGRIEINSLHVGWVNYHTFVFVRLLYAYIIVRVHYQTVRDCLNYTCVESLLKHACTTI